MGKDAHCPENEMKGKVAKREGSMGRQTQATRVSRSKKSFEAFFCRALSKSKGLF